MNDVLIWSALAVVTLFGIHLINRYEARRDARIEAKRRKGNERSR